MLFNYRIKKLTRLIRKFTKRILQIGVTETTKQKIAVGFGNGYLESFSQWLFETTKHCYIKGLKYILLISAWMFQWPQLDPYIFIQNNQFVLKLPENFAINSTQLAQINQQIQKNNGKINVTN